MKQIIKYAIILSAFMLNSCGLGPVKHEAKINRVIAGGFDPQASSQAQTNYVLLVQRPQANPAYQSQAMMYMPDRQVLKAFSKNQWSAPPASMLQNVIMSQIQASNYFKDVIPQAGIAHYDYKLVTQLIALRQEFWSSPSQIRLVFDASLVDPDSNQLLASRTFNIVENAPGNDPESGTDAANRAAVKLSERISWFVRQSINSLSN